MKLMGRRLGRRGRAMMASMIIAGAVASSVMASASAADATVMTDRCGNGMVLLAVRGTGEAPGVGGTAAVVRSYFNGDKDIPTWSQGIDYPAVAMTLNDTYYNSLRKGQLGLKGVLENIASTCKNASVGIVGYSQGAEVVGDVLQAGGLSTKAKNSIRAVALFGDPTYVPGEPWDAAGNGTKPGAFTARGKGAFKAWSRQTWPIGASAPVSKSIVKSWCFKGDMFCQDNLLGGSAAATVHASYGKKVGYEAYAWIRSWMISQS